MSEATEHTTKITAAVDELLNHVAQGTQFHFQSGLCGNWTLTDTQADKAGIHVITTGSCWFGTLAVPERAIQMQQGDAVFINHGVPHFLSREAIPAAVAAEDIPQFCQAEHQTHGVVCYDIEASAGAAQSLFSMLPAYVIIPAQAQTAALRGIIQTIQTEAKSAAAGATAVVQRLSDVVAIYLLREVVTQGEGLHGPLAALQDKALRPVVMALHEDLSRDWSVDMMANIAYLSVSAFADRCHKVTGFSPKRLLDQLRLQQARTLLSASNTSIELIAQQLGYQSTTAFSRFFKKYTGVSASEYRTATN